MKHNPLTTLAAVAFGAGGAALATLFYFQPTWLTFVVYELLGFALLYYSQKGAPR